MANKELTGLFPPAEVKLYPKRLAFNLFWSRIDGVAVLWVPFCFSSISSRIRIVSSTDLSQIKLQCEKK